MWHETKNTLSRGFDFESFPEAFAFVTQIALLAERKDHHPKITIDYRHVQIELTTHDTGSTLTEKDRLLAHSIDSLF